MEGGDDGYLRFEELSWTSEQRILARAAVVYRAAAEGGAAEEGAAGGGAGRAGGEGGGEATEEGEARRAAFSASVQRELLSVIQHFEAFHAQVNRDPCCEFLK